MLASRCLLFSEVRVPRLDPAPNRKRGAGFKTRVKNAAPVGRCVGGVWWRLFGVFLKAVTLDRGKFC